MPTNPGDSRSGRSFAARTGSLTFGGLGFQVLAEGTLVENTTIPYSNETLAVRYAPDTDSWSQHLTGTSYPLSTDENGNAWFNGTETLTIPLVDQSRRQIDLDAITEPTSVAYLYGGIIANGQGIVTFPNTFASNQLFEVILVPGPGCPADLDGDGTVDAPISRPCSWPGDGCPRARPRTSTPTAS